jgi:SAM-dependent methyltransferase
LRSWPESLLPVKRVQALKQAYFHLRAPLFVGRRVVCSCCGGHFRKFLRDGVDRPRDQARCPRCGSWERHRLLWSYLKERTTLLSDRLQVLHVAPEFVIGRSLASLPNIKYVSVDLESPLAMVQMDVTRLAFPDESFDFVLCSHVLEHVPDDQRALRELHRVLKRSGWAILQVPIKREHTFEDLSVVSPEDRLRLFGQRDHVRIYGRDFKDRISTAGFSVSVERYKEELGPEGMRRLGLLAEDDIYLCNKGTSFRAQDMQ